MLLLPKASVDKLTAYFHFNIRKGSSRFKYLFQSFVAVLKNDCINRKKYFTKTETMKDAEIFYIIIITYYLKAEQV